MILFNKSIDQIMDETLSELSGMGIDERNAGGVARLLLTAINEQLASYYKTLDVNHMQAYISKAQDENLDKIGSLLDCERRDGEANDDYRYRITKQIQVVASANRVALRLAALSVPGVKDVKMKRFTHGTGSFSVYVISDTPNTPEEILDKVEAVLMDQEAYGVRGEVYRPIVQEVEMDARLVFHKSVSDLERRLAITQAEDALKNYVNTRNVGEDLYINAIQKALHDVHDKIEEAIIFNYKINDRPVLNVDQETAWNQRFVESSKPNAIRVM